MRLMVTGASGFIGSHVVNQAFARSYKVVGVRRSSSSRPRISLTSEPSWITKQLQNLAGPDFAGIDAVVHLAAHSANVPYDSLERCMQENVMHGLAFFNAAADAGVKRFVVAGSSFEYGRSGERYEFIPTTAPLEPTLSYPASKAALSVALMALSSERNLQISIHRIFQVYGEGESEARFWPSLRRAAIAGEDFPMTSGQQVRDFVPVELVASKLLDAIEQTQVQPGVCQIVNLGTGKPQTLNEFAQSCWQHWCASGQLRIGAIPNRKGEIMRYVPEV